MARRGHRGADLLRDARARPRRGRAVARRPQAPAGPRRADRGQGVVPDGARRTSCPTSTRRRGRRGQSAESFPASDPPAHERRRHHDPSHAPRTPARAPAACRSPTASRSPSPVTLADGTETELDHGHVVIAAITTCTNTSNPSVMLGAGLLARNAVERGLQVQAVGQDVARPGLEGRHRVLRAGRPDEYLERSASTSSATAARPASATPARCRRRSPTSSTPTTSRSSRCCRGNRNFEGRINPDVKMNYLASPPLCVAYALAGTMDIDLLDEPLGQDTDGKAVYLNDIWPSRRGGRAHDRGGRAVGHVPKTYDEVYDGDERWNSLEVPEGDRFAWDDDSTYVASRRSSTTCRASREPVERHRGRARARPARRLGHHRPHLAGRLDQEGLAGRAVPARARRRAQGLQLLRLAPRQPRGDDARHVRQHPPAQPDRAAEDRGRRHAQPARRRARCRSTTRR